MKGAPLIPSIGVDGGVGERHTHTSEERLDHIDAEGHRPCVERKQTQHVEHETMTAVVQLVEIGQAQATLDVAQDETGRRRVGKTGLVFLHAGRGKQCGGVRRQHRKMGAEGQRTLGERTAPRVEDALFERG